MKKLTKKATAIFAASMIMLSSFTFNISAIEVPGSVTRTGVDYFDSNFLYDDSWTEEIQSIYYDRNVVGNITGIYYDNLITDKIQSKTSTTSYDKSAKIVSGNNSHETPKINGTGYVALTNQITLSNDTATFSGKVYIT